ncbi:rab-GTPase-TBC domain-containing protein [Lineolata rhizophorae]|uniref:Rab-GTPase-TBC domain-containing protein n=1 Tax=Lineolata rhizophorae TaxID=578093 RepID=A0A6A6P0Q6_9PEZI|nr:rab-GTPase-TBC domain-containing protein [Lineolata rhizophorae]
MGHEAEKGATPAASADGPHASGSGQGQSPSHASTSPPSRDSTSASKSHSLSWPRTVRRPKTSPGPRPSPFRNLAHLADDAPRRDSGLTPQHSPAADVSVADGVESAPSARRVPSLPAIVVQDETPAHADMMVKPDGERPKTADERGQGRNAEPDPPGPFRGITTAIPTGSFDDLTSPAKLEFSKRGSMLLDGKKLNNFAGGSTNGSSDNAMSPPVPRGRRPVPPASTSSRIISTDEDMLSRKVRSMYEHGDERAGDLASLGESTSMRASESAIEEEGGRSSQLHADEGDAQSRASSDRRASMIVREPTELAGGIEDWDDLEGVEVDRYGFIVSRKVSSTASSEPSTPQDQPGLQRVSTSLKLASESPRRRRTIRRSASNARSSRAVSNGAPHREASQRSRKAPGSVYSYQGGSSQSLTQSLRHAANRLPHNRDRRWMDEAGDMLTLPPGLADIAEQEEGGRVVLELKRREWAREDKWRKMATATNPDSRGGGMEFRFDTKDPKLVSRTWKGIPDRWRATAWHAFLSASAASALDGLSDQELIEQFHVLQDQSSPDDVQIDMDVPRTINRHIMFRRRYRGGQRLLFRVLHGLSLHLPETGYVQGMAALAATLLCYYDEELAFVMMVRLWQLRGLEHLYQSGFGGLMEALEDFRKNWLAGGDVERKLDELGIPSTAYGIRWYLTLFNYSIPFSAQLRVWDVFMLLGDKSNAIDPASSFKADLDILHATSAALMDATREILLDSDFENGMKVLTSFVPIKDEDLLMNVAKAEWKQRKRRARAA